MDINIDTPPVDFQNPPTTIILDQNTYNEMLQRLQNFENQATTSATANNITTSHSALKPVRPPTYDGTKNYAILESWITAVNSYFFLTNAKLPEIYYYLNILLVKDAAIWFRYQYPETTATTLNWPTIREAIRAYFVPPNKDRRLLDQWANLRQVGTVAEYASQFYKLGMQVPTMSDELLLDKFLRGLKPQTRREMEIQEPTTLAEAIRKADRYDSILFSKSQKTFNNNYYQQGSAIEYEPGGEPMQLDAFRPNHSRQVKTGSHKPAPRPKTNQPQMAILKKLTPEERDHLRNIGACFKCRKTGHMARECPTMTTNGSKN